MSKHTSLCPALVSGSNDTVFCVIHILSATSDPGYGPIIQHKLLMGVFVSHASEINNLLAWQQSRTHQSKLQFSASS